jgi:hypothetical protein
MANKKDNRWKEIDGGSAFVIPYTLLRHTNFRRLDAYGNKLVLDISRQYTGFNNGYLCASWALMKNEGWRSSETLWRTVLQLEHFNIILRTQQGGKHRPNLHAITWRRIDCKQDKPLDVRPTMKAGDEWKIEKPDFELKIIRPKSFKRRLLRAA